LPGSIKVSGSQRTVASPYIKVSGNWRQVAAGYIKVNGTWRVWHTADIVDNFNRVNSSTLGTASNGIAVWSNLRGSWGISNLTASSSDAASTYPIATTPLTKTTQNYTINLDIPSGAGAGIAFWVTNSTNWWAAVTFQENVSFYTCPNGGTLSGTTCDLGSSSYPATASQQTTSIAPNTSTTYYQTEVFGPSCAGGIQCPDGAPCINGLCYYDIGCDTRNPVSSTATSCSVTVITGCSQGTFNSFTGQCDVTTTVYTCPNGGYVSGTTCIIDNSYEATLVTGTSSQTRIIQSVNGTVSTRASQVTSGATRSLRVTTTGNQISVISYQSAGQTGTNNTLNHTPTSPAITGVLGIIKSPSSVNQTSAVDNFRAS
jgi:hypothetical protein